MIWPCWEYADAVVCSHGAVTSVDLGIIKRSLVYAALEIVGYQEAGPRTPEPEHAHMRANPIRETLRPGRLRVGEIGRAQHGEEDLSLAHDTGCRIDDRDLL